MPRFRVKMTFGDGTEDEQEVQAPDEHEALERCLYIDAEQVTITRLRGLDGREL